MSIHDDEQSTDVSDDTPQWAQSATATQNDASNVPIQRPEPELDDLVKQENAQKASRERRSDTAERSERALPGKDTQSVVVDMGQLNEEAEKAIQEKAH